MEFFYYLRFSYACCPCKRFRDRTLSFMRCVFSSPSSPFPLFWDRPGLGVGWVPVFLMLAAGPHRGKERLMH